MKRHSRKQHPVRKNQQTHQRAGVSNAQRREGSTLMIVIALLAMLSLLGVVFYTFASQERSNAEYFAAAAKERRCNIPAKIYFNYGLRQLIVGPNKNEVQSALWGGRHSLVINMLGYEPGQFVPTDYDEVYNDSRSREPFKPEAHPFTGPGIHLMMDNSGNVSVDQNYNGLADDGTGGEPDNRPWLESNLSWSSRWNSNIGDIDLVDPLSLPQPDVDYTSPDNNTLFASYDGYGIDGSGNPTRAIVPSFLRPWKVRNIANWWDDTTPATTTVALTLRPHPGHVDVAATLTSGSEQLLYVRTQAEADTLGFNAPFPFAPNNDGDGAVLEVGAFKNGDDKTDLDVDNDQDGINEGIWMYLGFPIQRCPEGYSYVALHSFTVVDLDALLNLNMHGNSPGVDTLTIDGADFVGNRFLAKSNQGMAPSEVNLQHGLYAQPPAAGSSEMVPYEQFFGGAPVNRKQLSDLEYWFLTRGRPEFSGSGDTQSDVTDLFPGRYGEANTALYNSIRTNAGAGMNAGAFPQAGTTGVNDQGIFFDPNSESPRFIQPLAYNGAGTYTLQHVTGTNGDYRYLRLVQPIGGVNPNTWLRYTGYNARSLPLWGNTLGGTLMQSTSFNANVDDAEEIIVDRKYLQPTDDVFSAEETALLHMSQVALDNVGLSPRLQKLLPYTMGSHADRRTTGKRFTSVSTDRKTAGFARTEIPGSPGQFARFWEFNSDFDNDGKFAFPPRFVPQGTSGREPFRGPLRQILETEDGRLPVDGLRQFRMNINRLLYTDSNGNPAYRPLTTHPNDPGTSVIPNWHVGNLPAFNDANGDLLLDADANGDGMVDNSDTRLREFWARYDRQQMARDIFVLLYTLGGGNDYRNYSQPNSIVGNDISNDPTGTLGLKLREMYDDVQLSEMAQFAVNVVDALDRDNIMTRFEYDKNLGSDGTNSGWNLGDNAFITSDDSAPPADRGIVHGVEAQQLTFSEALVLWAKKDESSGTATDHKVTQWDDKEDTYFTHLELRNVSPYQLDFDNGVAGSPSDNGAWQVDVEVTSTAAPLPSHRYLTIKKDTSIGAGGLFTIKSVGGRAISATSPNKYQDPVTMSDVAADIMIDQDYVDGTTLMPVYDYRISPVSGSGSQLDLIFPVVGRTNRYTLTNLVNPGGTTFASLLDHLNVGTPDAGTRITFRLRRRMHPGRATPADPSIAYNDDNPWIVVDEKQIVFQGGLEPLEIDGSDTNGADFLAASGANFNDIRSVERVQALDNGQTFDHNSGTSFRRNSIGVKNSRSAAAFTLWQPQFDRDFASIGELLSVPLYAPDEVTQYVRRNSLNPLIGVLNYFQGTHLAAARFLQPKHPSNYIDTLTGNPKVLPGSPGTPNLPTEADLDLDNRWYRMLEFVEVPTRTHLHLPLVDPLANTALDVPLVPGKVNPNMMRHPEVLAALLDAPQVAGDRNAYMLSATYMNNPNVAATHMPDNIEGNNRDWWERFLITRDRFDPLTNRHLPGLPGSRPFRSFSYSPSLEGQAGNTYTVEGLDSTLLRGLQNGDDRRLFEIGTANDFTVRGTNDTAYRNANRNARPIETPVRHKLLSKIAGNTTTRSHAFVVFMSVGFFEAREMSGGGVRIGGKLSGDPSDAADHRGVFVVNRALIDDAFNPSTGQIDWNKLVESRLTVK